MSQGLLTDRPADVRFDGTVEEATSSLDFEDAEQDLRIGARRICRFLQSAAVAAFQMRCRSLHSIAGAVAARRERLRIQAGTVSTDAIFGVAAAYEKLRPYIFTGQDKCLQDSLALVDFMASEGVSARWIIGVKTRPFGAHSWVQSGETVLNDQHDHVRQFSPILVVSKLTQERSTRVSIHRHCVG